MDSKKTTQLVPVRLLCLLDLFPSLFSIPRRTRTIDTNTPIGITPAAGPRKGRRALPATIAARPASHHTPAIERDAPTITAVCDARRNGALLCPRIGIIRQRGQVIVVALRFQITGKNPI